MLRSSKLLSEVHQAKRNWRAAAKVLASVDLDSHRFFIFVLMNLSLSLSLCHSVYVCVCLLYFSNVLLLKKKQSVVRFVQMPLVDPDCSCVIYLFILSNSLIASLSRSLIVSSLGQSFFRRYPNFSLPPPPLPPPFTCCLPPSKKKKSNFILNATTVWVPICTSKNAITPYIKFRNLVLWNYMEKMSSIKQFILRIRLLKIYIPVPVYIYIYIKV